MKFTALFAVICYFIPAQSWPKDLHCIGFEDLPGVWGIPLGAERIVRVPEKQQKFASLLLGQNSFRSLSRQESRELLGEAEPSASVVLELQAHEADTKAADCRELAENPFFSGIRNRYLATASEFDRYAVYLRSLPNELHPYLVKAKEGFEGTGSFEAYLKDDTVRVQNRSLGVRIPAPKEIALVVFTEKTISHADISYRVVD